MRRRKFDLTERVTPKDGPFGYRPDECRYAVESPMCRTGANARVSSLDARESFRNALGADKALGAIRRANQARSAVLTLASIAAIRARLPVEVIPDH